MMIKCQEEFFKMSVKIDNVEKNIIQLEIEVEPEKFEQGMQKAFSKNAKKFKVPGFRNGKAPRKMVEQMYGEQVLYEDAINFVCPEEYEKAIKDNNIEPVDRPEIDIVKIGQGEGLVFTAKVTTKPEIKLGEYKQIEVEKIDAEVTQEDVTNELKSIAEKNARLVSVEDKEVQNGNFVTLDFEGFIDGVPFENGKAENFDLEIGSGSFIEGFEEQLVGKKIGEEASVLVKFPDDYNAKDIAGKEAKFIIKIKAIKYKEVPELDDELAKDVSEFETLEEFRKDIEEKIKKSKEHIAKHELEDKIIAKIIENSEIDVPRVMVEKQVDNILKNYDMQLRYKGLDLNTYLQYSNIELDKFRESFSERAEKEVKASMVIEKIGNNEGIEATDDEIEEKIASISEKLKKSVEEVKNNLGEEYVDMVREEIVANKTVEFLVENAKIG